MTESRAPLSGATSANKANSRDYRLPVALLLLLAVALGGLLISWMPGRGVQATATPSSSSPRPPSGFSGLAQASAAARVDLAESLPADVVNAAQDGNGQEARRVFKEAVAHLKAKRYDTAIAALERAQPLMRKHAETYVLIGRALEGKQDFATARDFYNAAIDRNPGLPEAYWGYATASEGLGDLESALGGMRSYLHAEPDKDPQRLRVAQARSAIWEWEARLGRGPWGPTKGIPPGFGEADIRRDGRGVAIRMPIPGTEQPDGSLQSEMKSQDKLNIFRKP